MRPCNYLHSSGSTSLPKIIPQTFRTIHISPVHLDDISFFLAAVADHREHPHRQITGTQPLPPFHMFGFATQIGCTSYGLMTVALYPPITATRESQPMQATPQNVMEHARRVKCTPSLLGFKSGPKIVRSLISWQSWISSYVVSHPRIIFENCRLN